MQTIFLTVEVFAVRLGVSPQTIRRAIKAGRIHAFRVGIGKKSPFRIPETEIDRIAIMDFEEIVKNLKGKD